jgi:hypothetical protein
MGIFDRLGAMGGTDVGGALSGAHEHFQSRINTHGHFGRALIETIAETCRNHPNLVGIFVGVMVEQFLVHEKHHHEHELAEHAQAEHEAHERHPAIPLPRAAPHHTPHHLLRFAHIRPFRMAMEVFGALVLLKFSTGMAHLFQRKKHRGTLGTVSRIRLFSGTFATYYTAKALKSHEVSSLRNGLAMFFATRALKPLLRPDYRRLPSAPPPARPGSTPGFSLEPEMRPPEEGSRMFH